VSEESTGCSFLLYLMLHEVFDTGRVIIY